jgi:hypothetical protein
MQHRTLSTLVLLANAAAPSLACDPSDHDADARIDEDTTDDAIDEIAAADAPAMREPTDDELDGRARPIVEDGNTPSGIDIAIDVDPQADGYSSGWHAIVNARSGLCLDMVNNCLDVPDAMIDPVSVNRFPCHNGTNQQWLYTVQDEPFDCR